MAEIPPSPQIADKPLEGMSAILAAPTYGSGTCIPECQKQLRVAMMSAASKGLHWAGDASPDRLPYGTARNAAAMALRHATGVDGLVWVDSDILLEPDSIIRLLTTARTYDLDFVSGIYHARKKPNLPIIYHWDGIRYLQCLDYPPNTIQTVDACGFGFCYTSAKVINAIADYPDFDKKGGWFPDNRDSGGFGEDIGFCHQARLAGFRLYIDTGIQVGHQGDPVFIREKDFRDRRITLESPEIQEGYEQRKAGWARTAPVDGKLDC